MASEVARARIVRLDAEGNPVGEPQTVSLNNVTLLPEASSMDEPWEPELFKRFQLTVPLEGLSPETIKLLKGEHDEDN